MALATVKCVAPLFRDMSLGKDRNLGVGASPAPPPQVAPLETLICKKYQNYKEKRTSRLILPGRGLVMPRYPWPPLQGGVGVAGRDFPPTSD